jgi:non-heme chloroperoxidase
MPTPATARCGSPRARRLRALPGLLALALGLPCMQSVPVNAQTAPAVQDPGFAAPAVPPVTAPAAVPLSRTRFTTSDGVGLSVLEGGTPHAGTPLIAFVPGWSMPASLWQAQLAALGATHRVVALDPRGQGESDIPAAGYAIDRRADDIAELIARLPAREPVLLVGWSLGALEALRYVQRHGEARLAGLVLVDSSVGEDPPPTQGGDFLAGLRQDRAAALEGFVRAIFAQPRDEQEIVALVQGALRWPLEASLSVFPSAVPRAQWRTAARGFSRPLLYVVTPQFAAQGESLARHRPGTRVEVFAAAGHALFADEPERFNALLAAFAAGLRAP